MEAAELTGGQGDEGEQDTSGEHLCAGAHGFGFGQRELAREGRCDGPVKGGDEQGDGSGAVDGRAAEVEAVADERGDAGESDKERERKAEGEALSAQNDDFGQRHEGGDGGEHDGGYTGGYALLGPEKQAVVADEDKRGHGGGSEPLAAHGRGLAAKEHEEVKGGSGDEEADGGAEQRRDLVHADADGKKGRSPDEVDDAECGQGQPSGWGWRGHGLMIQRVAGGMEIIRGGIGGGLRARRDI